MTTKRLYIFIPLKVLCLCIDFELYQLVGRSLRTISRENILLVMRGLFKLLTNMKHLLVDGSLPC